MHQSNKTDYFKNLADIVRLAIEEDLGTGDITGQLIPRDQNVIASVMTREDAVVCGQPWFDEVIRQIDSDIKTSWLVTEGTTVSPDQKLVDLSGHARSILAAERTALNFLQTLMSTATTARMYAGKIKGQKPCILDTRKTIPGLRLAQKYAVAIGGCQNHRMGLYDAFLIKENHIAACGSIATAIERAREIKPSVPIEIEVETIEELQQAIDAGADRIMLDNFSVEQIRRANALKTQEIKYEVSGNINEGALASLADLGVDHISSGSLTKNIRAIDLSMRILSQ